MLSFGLFAAVAGSFGHGLIENPPSRSWICGAETKPDQVMAGTGQTQACSTAFAINQLAGYNYMAVVTHTLGRAKVSPLPKNVCGFDGETWNGAKTPWDVAMNWPTTPMTAGPRDFTWNIQTGPHFDDTDDFKYWITKASFVFSPTKELTWDDFETEPFCDLRYDDKNPTANPDIKADKPKSLITTRCNVPQRNGHHVIYGEWGRLPPTYERFHGCVDASFGATTTIEAPRTPAARLPRFEALGAKRIDLLGRTRQIGSGVLLINQ